MKRLPMHVARQTSNVQLEGAPTAALFLNFLLEPLRAVLVMNIDTLNIAVCDQRQNID